MNESTRRALESYAGKDLDGRMIGPFKVGIDEPPLGVGGVYIVFDVQGTCSYVGKAYSPRDPQRVKDRLLTHVRDLRKRERFATFYLIPLSPDAGSDSAEKLEGWVARHMKPTMGSSHPDPSRR